MTSNCARQIIITNGEVSIADAVQLLNDILGVSLPRQVAAAGVALEVREKSVVLHPTGAVGGVEFTVVSESAVSAVNHESVSVQLNCVGKRTRVAVYSEDARPLSEADLLTVAGQFSIKDLRAVDRSGNEITADIVSIPSHFVLHNPYPNPFNPTTTIRYDLPEAGRVSLIIYDILGRKVAVAVDSWQEAGAHEVVWSAADIPSGDLFCEDGERCFQSGEEGGGVEVRFRGKGLGDIVFRCGCHTTSTDFAEVGNFYRVYTLKR